MFFLAKMVRLIIVLFCASESAGIFVSVPHIHCHCDAKHKENFAYFSDICNKIDIKVTLQFKTTFLYFILF
jgi:hypothetical protein